VCAALLPAIASTPARAACDFQHPGKAKQVKMSLVQAFVGCNVPGGQSPNGTTEGGIASCQPSLTFNQQAGSPSNGWRFDPERGQGSISFKAARNKVISPLNPPGSQDVEVGLSLSGVISDDEPDGVTAPGVLAALLRWTMNDRGVDDVEDGDDVSMTLVDFPANFSFLVSDGKVKLKTSLNALLNDLSQPGLPGCSAIDVLDVAVKDGNGTPFARPGLYLTDEIPD
jgi:hypothetical protein